MLRENNFFSTSLFLKPQLLISLNQRNKLIYLNRFSDSNQFTTSTTMLSSISAVLLVSLTTSTPLYIGRTELVNYDTAKKICQSSGGQLATFGNEVEWEQIRAVRAEYNTYFDDSIHVNTKNAYGLWIGLDDLKGEGLWEFIDGDVSYCAPQSSSIYDCDDIPEWAANQPDNTHTEGSHCA
eukprot:37906_1